MHHFPPSLVSLFPKINRISAAHHKVKATNIPEKQLLNCVSAPFKGGGGRQFLSSIFGGKFKLLLLTTHMAAFFVFKKSNDNYWCCVAFETVTAIVPEPQDKREDCVFYFLVKLSCRSSILVRARNGLTASRAVFYRMKVKPQKRGFFSRLVNKYLC